MTMELIPGPQLLVPTAPTGDSSNRPASTQFVSNQMSSLGLNTTSFSTVGLTVSAGAGSLTSAAGTALWHQMGKIVFVSIAVTITTNGSASTFVAATLPASAAVGNRWILAGRETGVSGKMLQGVIDSGNRVVILNYDTTYPGADGAIPTVSGFYETV